MNFRKLITYLTMGTAAAMPLAVAQNPTILQGSYISNVFGNSNFVLNPNAQTNVANVTNATRSTTTPLVATSEFTLSLASGANATWTLRAFDGGMKGQNCEARFTYRGFATATTKAEIVQNSLVVASLTLTPTTDPRIASINFPCGDLANLTTFRIAQTTANMTGTNEIGGIYVGLATNMANVAQAEFIGSLAWPANATSDTRTGTAWQAFQTLGSVDPTIIGNVTSPNRAPRITVPNLKAGNYRIIYTGSFGAYSSTDVDSICFFRITDGAASPTVFGTAQTVRSYGAISSNNGVWTPVLAFDFQYTGATQSMTFFLETAANGANNFCRVETYTNAGLKIAVYRFPSSSELVVTPERQNVFAAASWDNDGSFSRTTTAEITISNANFATNRTAFGKAQFTANANDVAITVPQMPPGTYRIELTGRRLGAQNGTAATRDIGCRFYLKDGTNTAQAQTSLYGIQYSIDNVSSATQIVRYTSVADRTFTASLASDYATATECFVGQPKIIITPLDQPSNSALYVQGPVKAAETGAAIPASYVGEEKIAYATNTSTVNNDTEVDVTGASITLDPGVWELQYSSTVLVERTPASTSGVYCRLRIRDSANNAEASTESTTGLYSSTNDASWNFFEMSKNKRINLTSTKTFKLSITSSVSSSVAVCIAQTGNLTGGITGNEATTYIRAVRLN